MRTGATPHIVACISHAKDCQALIRATRGVAELQFCATVNEAMTEARTPAVYGVILEIRPGSVAEIVAATRVLVADSMPLLLRFALNKSIAVALARIAKTTTFVIPSLRGQDDLEMDFAQLATSVEPEESAEMATLAAVSSIVPSADIDLVVGAILVAKRATRVGRLALACSCPAGNIRTRCRRAKLPQPKVLLAWPAGVKAMWLMGILKLSEKEVAARMKYPSPRALSNHLERFLGARPRELLLAGGWPVLLGEFADVLRSAQT
jgi:hypothetical protein